MRIDVKGLWERNGHYYFRRAVPPELREAAGRWEWKQALGLRVGQETEAHRVVKRLWAQAEREITRLRAETGHRASPAIHYKAAAEWAWEAELLDSQPGSLPDDDDPEFADSQRDLHRDYIIEKAGREFGWDRHGRPQRFRPEQEARLETLKAGKPVTPPLTVSAARDLYLQDRFVDATDKATEAATAQFIDMIGDRLLTAITRLEVGQWVRRLASERRQSAGTIKRRLGSMKALFNYARLQHGLEVANPFERHEPPREAAKPKSYKPFHRTHLEAIDRYLVRDGVNPDTRRILTLLRLTGCRPLEIGGLSRNEVYLDADVPLLRLRETPERRLKTEGSSARPVPLVGAALEAAKEAVASARGEYLFPPSCRNSSGLSQRLNKALRAAGVPKTPQLSAYSFRNTISEALRVSGASKDLRDGLLGHAEPGAAGRYGAEHRPVSLLRDALENAIPHLGEVDETQYLPGELL